MFGLIKVFGTFKQVIFQNFYKLHFSKAFNMKMAQVNRVIQNQIKTNKHNIMYCVILYHDIV